MVLKEVVMAYFEFIFLELAWRDRKSMNNLCATVTLRKKLMLLVMALELS
jgi:hypothetical protein